MVLHTLAHRRFASRRTSGVRLRGARLTLCLVAPLFVAPTSALRSEESRTGTIMYNEEQALNGASVFPHHQVIGIAA